MLIEPNLIALRGVALLENPITNKGTAFDEAERREFRLEGLLPPAVETLAQQEARAYELYSGFPDDLSKHVYLRALQDTNETLFYRLLVDHVEEMAPIVYTPTVGLACQRFSHIYRRPRGLFLSYPQRDRLVELLANRPHRDVDAIVVTDGQRILGLGDQGADGLGIPIGKLSLYTAIAGIRPARTLPVVLDVGTNNRDRLADPEYLGWRHERVEGQAYFDFIERFVQAVEIELPHALVQWEDFAVAHAMPILERYRNRLLTFNDDIQGTGAVVAGTLLGAVRASGGRMRDQRVAILGAGSAAIGVADILRREMVADGCAVDEAPGRFYLVNSHGLLTSDRVDLSAAQRAYAQPPAAVAGWSIQSGGRPDLGDVVANVELTVLIGLSTVGGAFTEALVREMARKVSRPIIFPLSNPTSRSEAAPADLDRWTEGRALVATGSPYPPVIVGDTALPVAQCNNVYIFPAVGLGAIASGATRVTDGMMFAAANALGAMSPVVRSRPAPLLPAVSELRHTAVEIATAVAVAAVRDGVAPRRSDEELAARVREAQWQPAYPREA